MPLKHTLNIMTATAVITLLTACGGGGGGGAANNDTDQDGIINSVDNCPNNGNPGQEDIDGDGLGDACDATNNNDTDGDGINNDVDNCPANANPGQEDIDNDGLGDACDATNNNDTDGDGINNNVDNCPMNANPGQEDIDNDGLGDACDATNNNDTDGDGINNNVDNCPMNANPGQEDIDGDGLGDACDAINNNDTDGDGINNNVDNCPMDANPGQEDTDGDGVGDACDTNNGGAGAASASRSTISAASTFIDQTSSTGTTITVQLKDNDGNNVTTGGENVELFTTSGTLNATQPRPTTDNNDGTYTATLTTDQDVSAITVTGTLNDMNISDTARIGVKVSMNTAPSALAALGAKIFVDENLSTPVGQSCATCHDITSGTFIDIRKVGGVNPDTSQGADPSDFGGRNSPTVSYTAHIPNQFNRPGGKLVGGQFWDGRTESLEEQARQPFLDPVEMGNPDKATLINKIKAASYADEFRAVFGANSLDNVETAFVQVSETIAAFERGRTFSPFTSKWDAVQAGTETFTASEANGERLFRNGGCTDCHFTPDDLLGAQMFTNFEYENIGVPSQAGNPLLVADPNFQDFGAGSAPEDATQGPHSVNPPGVDRGKFKVPGLRNIANTAPYMHNGAFATLLEVVDFYNGTLSNNRDAEVQETVFVQYTRQDFFETPAEKQDVINFMNTLSDRF